MESEIEIDVFYLNCNGLNDKLKRHAVFSRLKRSAKGLYFFTRCVAIFFPRVWPF